MEGWELDSCGDCWVSDGCLVDSNDAAFAIDAHMYRYVGFLNSMVRNAMSELITSMLNFELLSSFMDMI